MRNIFNLSASSVTVKDISVCLLVFILSFVIGIYYTESDLQHYIAAYKAIENSGLLDGFSVYISFITTEEPIHYLIIWVLSSVIGIDKLLSMSLFNGLLSFLFIRFIRINGGASLVAYTIVLTNFYFMALYFAGERLKFSFILLLLALLTVRRTKESYLFFMLSISPALTSIPTKEQP
jgi:hypothetical protein